MKRLRKDNKGQISAGAALTAVAAVIVIVILIAVATFEVVPVGSVGVPVTLGTIGDEIYPADQYWINPVTKMNHVNIQSQEYEYKKVEGTLTKEGLEVVFDASIVYHVDGSKAINLFETVRGDYFDTLITPAFMGISRDEIKKWTAEDIYTGMSTEIQDDVFTRLKANLAPRGIVLEAVYLRGIILPPLVKEAIENKIKEKQAVEQMHFTVEKEKGLAEQKIIQANATAQANEIIASSITPNLILWKQLDIHKALAETGTNTFVIDTGNSGTTPPMILPVEKN